MSAHDRAAQFLAKIPQALRREVSWPEARSTIIAFATVPLLPAVAGSVRDADWSGSVPDFSFGSLILPAYLFCTIL